MPKLRETPRPTPPTDPIVAATQHTLNQPTPASRLEEMREWLKILPEPPKPFGDQSPDSVGVWLDDCVRRAYEVGGYAKAIQALDWIEKRWEWRFAKWIKEDKRGWFGAEKRKLDQQAREESAVAQQRQHEDVDKQTKELLREKGWG